MKADLIELTRRAGEAILEIYASDFEVQVKADTSPLTLADLAAHRIIESALRALTPDIPVLSEESTPPAFSERRRWQRYWLVDPLDGTKEFVDRNGEFTVNIALIEDRHPVLGFVGVPVQNTVYVGDVRAGTCERYIGDEMTRLSGRKMRASNGVTVVASRHHGGDRLETYFASLQKVFPKVDRTPVGSSLKLCILAEGEADLYPRLGPTSEWDIAAAHAVLEAAGGDVWQIGGAPMQYNKAEFLNPEFIAVSDAAFPWFDTLPAVPPL